MPRIPAICNNPHCGTVFPSSFLIENSSNISLYGMMTGPCPSCGSKGRIPNGQYSTISEEIHARLTSISDVQLLNKIKSTIQDAVAKREFEGLDKKVTELDKGLSTLLEKLPENKENKIAVLSLFVATIGVAVAAITPLIPYLYPLEPLQSIIERAPSFLEDQQNNRTPSLQMRKKKLERAIKQLLT